MHSDARIRPISIERTTDTRGIGDGIQIQWSDGKESLLSAHTLRTLCPCATCQELRGDTSHSKPLSPSHKSSAVTNLNVTNSIGTNSIGLSVQGEKKGRALLKVVKHTKEQEVDLRSIKAVGSYALGVVWGDGHSSGIYSYPYLYALSGEGIAIPAERQESVGFNTPESSSSE